MKHLYIILFVLPLIGFGQGWEQTLEGGVGYSVIQTNDGGYIVTGFTDNDVCLIKTDQNGEEQWSQTFEDGTGDGYGKSVQQTNDGGYIITGVKFCNQGVGNGGFLFLIKTDQNGEEQWSQTFGENSFGFSVEQTTDGGYIITGGDNNYIYIIKTNEFGNITSTIELPTPSSKRELIKTTNILGQENTTIKNQPLIEIYDDGSTEKKIVIE